MPCPVNPEILKRIAALESLVESMRVSLDAMDEKLENHTKSDFDHHN